MPIQPIKDTLKTRVTKLVAVYRVAIVVLLLGIVVYREYYRWYLPQQIDPINRWLFVTNRNASLVTCSLLAVVALVLEWRCYRASGKSSLFASFPGLALLAVIATLFVYTAYGR